MKRFTTTANDPEQPEEAAELPKRKQLRTIRNTVKLRKTLKKTNNNIKNQLPCHQDAMPQYRPASPAQPPQTTSFRGGELVLSTQMAKNRGPWFLSRQGWSLGWPNLTTITHFRATVRKNKWPLESARHMSLEGTSQTTFTILAREGSSKTLKRCCHKEKLQRW